MRGVYFREYICESIFPYMQKASETVHLLLPKLSFHFKFHLYNTGPLLIRLLSFLFVICHNCLAGNTSENHCVCYTVSAKAIASV